MVGDDEPWRAEKTIPGAVAFGEAARGRGHHLLVHLAQDLVEHVDVAWELQRARAGEAVHHLGLIEEHPEKRVVDALHPHHEPLFGRPDVHREAALRRPLPPGGLGAVPWLALGRGRRS